MLAIAKGEFLMSWFNYFVITTLSLVTILSVIMAFQLRRELKKMAGMMISMAIGMNVGLTAGILLGSLYQGNLYYSTILSIFTGALAGIACGLVFGVLPSIEGFMAGIMGGMMGAMLGEMITLNQSATMINIFLTISVCSLLLFPILHEPADTKNNISIIKPLFTFLFLIGYLLLGNQLDKQVAQSKSTPFNDAGHNHSVQEGKNHSNHPSPGGQKENKSKELTINVHPSNFSYDPKTIILKKGQQVRLTLNNHDSLEHDIEIKRFPVTFKQGDHHTGHKNYESDFHLHAAPNNKSEMIFTPKQSGTFEFYCTIPGHKDNGMAGMIIVD
jgi:uncharacterized cupredoxin-like copper-binding protein